MTTGVYYNVTNADTKQDYVVMGDARNFTIYNVTRKKLQRTIPHKDEISSRLYSRPKKGM